MLASKDFTAATKISYLQLGSNWWSVYQDLSTELAWHVLVKTRLRQVSVSILRQLCDDTPEWARNPFSSVYIYFNEKRIASVVTE